MKKKKKESLMDFLRNEAKYLELMNYFLYLFRENDIIYACNQMRVTHIPSFFYGKYEVTKVVPAKFRIRRPLFKDPELIVDQPPELWARCLEKTIESRSSVDNYHRTEYTSPSSDSANKIYFWKGSAISVLGKVCVTSHPELYVFNSSIAYAADPERVEKFETLTDFEQHYCKPDHRHYCIARISRLPILCFPA